MTNRNHYDDSGNLVVEIRKKILRGEFSRLLPAMTIRSKGRGR